MQLNDEIYTDCYFYFTCSNLGIFFKHIRQNNKPPCWNFHKCWVSVVVVPCMACKNSNSSFISSSIIIPRTKKIGNICYICCFPAGQRKKLKIYCGVLQSVFNILWHISNKLTLWNNFNFIYSEQVCSSKKAFPHKFSF